MPGIFGSTNYGFNSGDINAVASDRNQEINTFANQLSALRAQYLAQIPSLNKAAFDQFGGDAAAAFGAKGLDTGSGAFQDSLAREAIKLQAGMTNTAYQSGIQNADTVNNAYGQNANALLQARTAGLSRPTPNPLGVALGGLGGAASGSALGPVGAAAGSSLASAIFPGSTPSTPGGWSGSPAGMNAMSAATPMNYPANAFPSTPTYTGNGTGMWR